VINQFEMKDQVRAQFTQNVNDDRIRGIIEKHVQLPMNGNDSYYQLT